MQWTLSGDGSKANHAPVVVVNGSSSGPEPLFLEAEVDSEITLDASQSYDPDGDELTFHWFQYKEPTAAQSHIHWPQVAEISFEPVDGKKTGAVVRVKLPPAAACAVDILRGNALEKGQQLHLILEVKDNGTPSLTTYKRVVLPVTNIELRGGAGKSFDTITEALGKSVGK